MTSEIKSKSQTQKTEAQYQNYKNILQDYARMFRNMDTGNIVVDYKIKGYSEDDILRYIESPITYQTQLVDLSNYIYSTMGYYRESMDFYVKTALYRYYVNSRVVNIDYKKAKADQWEKDYIEYCNKINQLDLGVEFHRILLKAFLEDAVFGYWLEDGDNSTIYYLPSSWCALRKKTNGRWNYYINTSRVSQRDIEKLPKELQSLINKYKGKSAEEAYADVPPEKSMCVKFNDTLNYVLPPFIYMILLVLELLKAKQLEKAKNEGDSTVLIEMLIPIDEKDDDHLRLTGPTIEKFAVGLKELSPDNVAVLPTPMPLSVLETNKNQTSQSNIVKNAISAFGEESFIPSLGAANNSAEMKKAIQNASAKVFVLMDQIASAINLKMKLDGYGVSGPYEFNYHILHMNVFNEEDVINQLIKDGQSGSVNKFKLSAAQGNDPMELIGQYYIENVIMRDMFDNMTVLPSSHVQSVSSDDGGRPLKNEDDLTDSGRQARDDSTNAPEARDI